MVEKVVLVWLFLCCCLGLFWMNGTVSVYGVTSIPDGNATGSNFSPFVVDKMVKQNWRAKKGGKEYRPHSGRKLVYDVYSGESGQSLKQGWQIVNADKGRGNEPFLQFHGWSAIEGHHHHVRNNQATYLVAVNPQTNKEFIYKAEMTNLDAGKDFEFYKTSETGPINNLCPDTTFNVESNICNMKYEWVGFKAWIPLNDLFPNPDMEGEWTFYIVKNVEGNIVYDQLITPFKFGELPFKNGMLGLDSGKNTNQLIINATEVIRRSVPRGVNTNERQKYFSYGQTYTRVSQDEKAGVAVWYGVISPHDNNAVRWTSSAYWTFGGSIASLSYRISYSDITIRHIDAEKKKVLATEKSKMILNHSYNIVPKPKGHFKDEKGNPYVASPEGQGVKGTVKDSRTFDFYYRVSLPDPTEVKEKDPGSTGKDGLNPKVEGKVFWELRRTEPGKPSDVYIESRFDVTGNHYAVRKTQHHVNIAGQIITKENPITLLKLAKDIKGKALEYKYSYEYTNFYRDNYECVKSQGTDCFEWKFTGRSPEWNRGETFTLSDKIMMNHQQEDTINKSTFEEVLSVKWLVGMEDAWDYPVKKSKDFYEQWTKAKGNTFHSEYILKTQSSLPITPGQLVYTVEVPSGEHLKPSFQPFKKELSYGYYFPVDVDDSLKEDYKNNTSYTEFSYMFPLQQSIMTDKGKVGATRSFEMEYVTDLFFMTKHTGFIAGYPYAEKFRKFHFQKKAIPSFNKMVQEGTKKTAMAYEQMAGQSFVDEILYVDGVGQMEKLQRYMIPVDPNSPLRPNTLYRNRIILENMGLNDGRMSFDQRFKFERYLFGTGADNAWVIEQSESRVSLDTVSPQSVHKIVIRQEEIGPLIGEAEKKAKGRLHGFRLIDRDIIERIKILVGF